MKYYKKIIGKRIYLSPVNADDMEIYIRWMNETVAQNFGQYPLVISSKSDLKWLFEPPADMQRYAMVLLDGDIMIGSVSIHNIDHLNRNAFLGIFIGEEEYRNNSIQFSLSGINFCKISASLNIMSIIRNKQIVDYTTNAKVFTKQTEATQSEWKKPRVFTQQTGTRLPVAFCIKLVPFAIRNS